jgi:hypothetical protein
MIGDLPHTYLGSITTSISKQVIGTDSLINELTGGSVCVIASAHY